MRTIRTKVYQFGELSKEAQRKAVETLYLTEDRKVKITDSYEYPIFLKGMAGIIVKVTPEGANIWLPVYQGAKDYETAIHWFPFSCFQPTNEYEFKEDGTRF